MLNTHHYDGKLIITDFIADIERVKKIDKVTKLTKFNKLADLALTIFQKRNLSVIIRDYKNNSRANYDSSNNLDAADLLYLCCEKMDDDDFRDIFILQLDDMTSGMCPQGRTTRLFQVLSMMSI